MSSVGNKVTVDRSTFLPTPSAPWNTVIDRFEKTMSLADSMLVLLIGTNGTSGYLGILNELINNSAPVFDIKTDDINTDIVINPVIDPPRFNKNDLSPFPDFVVPDPDLQPLPSVDVSHLLPPTPPQDINPSISWTELNLNQDIYKQLLARILNDINNGATGLTDEIQEDIFNSGRLRQKKTNDRAYQRVLSDIAGRGSSLPSGALLAAITEISADILDQDSELNRTILTTQADLAQKNSQFIIEQARVLETLLRDTRDKDSNRALDYAKAVPLMVIQIYAEKVKLYIAIAEANKSYVEAQVENLKAVISFNLGMIDQYKATLQAYGIKVDAIAKKNSSLADIFKAEVAGYDSETTAISKVDSIKIEKIKNDIAAGYLKLSAVIENAKSAISGYETESNLREKVSNDMAGIANQAIVGALSSVNASASLGYHGSESKSENWSHSDQLGESHSYPHDSTA